MVRPTGDPRDVFDGDGKSREISRFCYGMLESTDSRYMCACTGLKKKKKDGACGKRFEFGVRPTVTQDVMMDGKSREFQDLNRFSQALDGAGGKRFDFGMRPR